MNLNLSGCSSSKELLRKHARIMNLNCNAFSYNEKNSNTNSTENIQKRNQKLSNCTILYFLTAFYFISFFLFLFWKCKKGKTEFQKSNDKCMFNNLNIFRIVGNFVQTTQDRSGSIQKARRRLQKEHNRSLFEF